METKYFDEQEIRWKHPKTIIVSGASNTGKSTIIFELIRNRDELLISKNRLPVRYHLPAQHRIAVDDDIIQDNLVKFFEGLPDFTAIHEPCIVVLDDMASQINESVLEAYTMHSHHRQISVILVTHNLFHAENKNIYRTISLNTNLFFLTKNVRSPQQIRTLAQQIDSGKTKNIVQAYKDAISRPFGYFVIDFSPTTDDRLRFRTNIFPSDPPPHNVVYLV